MSKRDDRIKRMQAQQVKQVNQEPQESWFSNVFGNYDKRLQALSDSNPLKQVVEEPILVNRENSLYQDAPAINPQSIAAAYGNRIAPATTDLQGTPITVPVQRKSVGAIRANLKAPSLYPSNVPERISLERRGMPMAQQRAPLSVHNIMDTDAGTAGYGINW